MTDYNIIAPSVIFYNLVEGDTFYMGPAGSISTVLAVIPITHNDTGASPSITIDGSILSAHPAIFGMYSTGENFAVTIGETGQILSHSGIYAETTVSLDITNHGEIIADAVGISISNSLTGPAAEYFITNTGEITVSGTNAAAIRLGNQVLMPAARNLVIDNSGTISGDYSIRLSPMMINENLSIDVTNSGSLSGRIDLMGLSGNDVIRNLAGGSITDLGSGGLTTLEGNDRVVNYGEIEGTVYLGAGDDIYRGMGTGTAPAVDGGLGNDKLYGSNVRDLFWGGEGNDTLMGFGGDDELFADPGNDLIVGGAGFDTINLYFATGDQVLDLLNPNNNTGLTQGDTIRGVEGVRGSSFADSISGSHIANTLNGGAGNDFLYGDGGADTLLGGEGDDTLLGGNGHDLLQGGNGNDLLWGDRGADTLQGDDGDDTLDGGSLRDNDLLVGGAGADTFILYKTGGKDIVQDLSAEDIVQLNGFTGMTAAQVIAQYGSETVNGAQLQFAGADIITFTGADLDLLEDVLVLV